MNKNKFKLVTHSGSFHADDIFSAATLALILEKENKEFEIIRTRDMDVIEKGDYVFDVGGIHDEEINRFDHHQKGGAGVRKNNVEYASFGLVWKKFGVVLSGSQKVADIIDRKLVAPIDASDNGIDLIENRYDISPYFIQNFFIAMRPTWKEKNLSEDDMFLKCVEIAKLILDREIIQEQDSVIAEEKVIDIYNNAKDKRVLFFDEGYPYENVLSDYPESLFVIYKRETDGLWAARAVRKDMRTFRNRKDFPVAWAGLRDKELQDVTKVDDAVFCHRGLFLAVAKSKEGAMKLAELALLV